MCDRILEYFEGFNKDNLDFLLSINKAYTKQNNLPKLTELVGIQNQLKNYDVDKFKYIIKSYGWFRN